MHKHLLILILTLLVFNCTDSKQLTNLKLEIDQLRAENDSLKTIVADINKKFVFDSITVRDIPSYKNTYELNSDVLGEIVFVGYNNDRENNYAILVDSVTYNPKKLYNPDTLTLKNGGYHYQTIMDSENIYWKADIQTSHKYGKKYGGVLYNTAKMKKN